MIACHELTDASHGNASGMGLADVITKAFADSIDHEVTRTNIITSGFLLRGKLPLVADDDRHAWELCLRGAGWSIRHLCGRCGSSTPCIVATLWVSDALLPERHERQACHGRSPRSASAR